MIEDDRAAERQVRRAVSRLVVLGLLERESDGALRIHRLVSAFAQQAMPDDGALAAVEQALTDAGNRLVNAGFPARLVPVIAHLHGKMKSKLDNVCIGACNEKPAAHCTGTIYRARTMRSGVDL